MSFVPFTPSFPTLPCAPPLMLPDGVARSFGAQTEISVIGPSASSREALIGCLFRMLA